MVVKILPLCVNTVSNFSLVNTFHMGVGHWKQIQLFPEPQKFSERVSFLCKNEQFLINQVILDGQGNLFHLKVSKGAVCAPHVYTVSCLALAIWAWS